MACDTIKIETLDADEVVSIVTAGPQGPSGAEAATLTTTGDLLYRAALANDRLPIGSEGQVLKVSSGLPAWGNESGAVTSVNGETGAVVLDAADVGAAPASGIDPTAITGTAVVDSDPRLNDARTPSSTLAHASSHAAAGSDPLAPSDIGAQSIFEKESITINSNITLNSSRAKIYSVLATNSCNIVLPTIGILEGDIIIIRRIEAGSGTVTISRGNFSPQWVIDFGQQFRYVATGTNAIDWALSQDVDTHTHAASEITSGTLDIARIPTGTGSTQVALGDHTHTQLHDRSHAITSTSDHTAGNHKVFYSDGSGQIQELALGNSGEVLTSNGASAAPSFAAASGGDTVSIDASAADVLTATSGAISADDGGTIDSSDPFIKWDDTAGKLVYANPLSRPSGAFYVGLAPTTTALGTDAINIQPERSAATNVASNQGTIAIGRNTRASGQYSIAIGDNCQTSQNRSVVIGFSAGASVQTQQVVIGNQASSNATSTVVIGHIGSATGANAVALGQASSASGATSVALGSAQTANLRGMLSAVPFNAVYWGGTTTNDTPLILNLDATATNRFTIAADTALAVDILLVARRSDTADKWLVARRFLGIRRDGSNNTSLIGSVQTLGTDQTDGSPTWSFTLTADDTNEALQLEVTGAASETVQWRATAFYRVA